MKTNPKINLFTRRSVISFIIEFLLVTVAVLSIQIPFKMPNILNLFILVAIYVLPISGIINAVRGVKIEKKFINIFILILFSLIYFIVILALILSIYAINHGSNNIYF